MTNFIRDNTSLWADKSNIDTVTNPTKQWTADDIAKLKAALIDIQGYLRGGLLDAPVGGTTVTGGLGLVSEAPGPSVAPELEFVLFNGSWYEGGDVANQEFSRDFVITGLRRDYSFSDGATTNGSPTLTSAARGGFTSALVGASISGAGIPAGTTISAVAGTTSLTMSANATATATGVRVTIVTGASQDIMYWRHRGGQSPTLGIGVTPPGGSHRLEVSPQDDEPAMGGFLIRRGPSQTGNVFTIRESGGSDRMWIDNNFFFSGNNAGGVGVAFIVQADTTNQRAVCWTGSDKQNIYGFSMPTGAGGLTRFSCISGGANSFDVLTDGSFKHISSKIGFFAAAATTKPTVTGSRGGNAALASLITALATLGLITDSTSA